MAKRKPKMSYFKPFGYKCVVLNNGKDDLGMFDPKSDKGVFVGQSSISKSYRIYNKRTQSVEESVHIVFDEASNITKGNTPDNNSRNPIKVPEEKNKSDNDANSKDQVHDLKMKI